MKINSSLQIKNLNLVQNTKLSLKNITTLSVFKCFTKDSKLIPKLFFFELTRGQTYFKYLILSIIATLIMMYICGRRQCNHNMVEIETKIIEKKKFPTAKETFYKISPSIHKENIDELKTQNEQLEKECNKHCENACEVYYEERKLQSETEILEEKIDYSRKLFKSKKTILKQIEILNSHMKREIKRQNQEIEQKKRLFEFNSLSKNEPNK